MNIVYSAIVFYISRSTLYGYVSEIYFLKEGKKELLIKYD